MKEKCNNIHIVCKKTWYFEGLCGIFNHLKMIFFVKSAASFFAALRRTHPYAQNHTYIYALCLILTVGGRNWEKKRYFEVI